MRHPNELNERGRPTVLTTDVVKVLEDVIKDGGSVTQACDLAQISRQSFYNHMRENEDFFYKMCVAREHLKLKALKNVVEAIEEGDLKTSIWFLEKWSQLNQPSKNKEDSEYVFGVSEMYPSRNP